MNRTRHYVNIMLRAYKLSYIDDDKAIDSIFALVDRDLRINSSSFIVGISMGILLTILFFTLFI